MEIITHYHFTDEERAAILQVRALMEALSDSTSLVRARRTVRDLDAILEHESCASEFNN